MQLLQVQWQRQGQVQEREARRALLSPVEQATARRLRRPPRLLRQLHRQAQARLAALSLPLPLLLPLLLQLQVRRRRLALPSLPQLQLPRALQLPAGRPVQPLALQLGRPVRLRWASSQLELRVRPRRALRLVQHRPQLRTRPRRSAAASRRPGADDLEVPAENTRDLCLDLGLGLRRQAPRAGPRGGLLAAASQLHQTRLSRLSRLKMMRKRTTTKRADRALRRTRAQAQAPPQALSLSRMMAELLPATAVQLRAHLASDDEA